MRLTFLGGTGTVTGSKYLLETGQATVLIDCGLYQGYKWLRERNWQPLPFDIGKLDAVILTHAHLDHSGYIPVLYQQGFRGPVFCHHATKDLCEVLLKDSGHLQEEDARFYTRHHQGKHDQPQPLYDEATAVASCELFRGMAFHQDMPLKDLSFYLQPAGHILGASSIIIKAEGKTLGFSGDVGRSDDILMYPPEPLPDLDVLLLESTYGNRQHADEPVAEKLAHIVNETVKRGGNIVVPCFAVGRAQALQHVLSGLIASQQIPDIPVYLDSPMAINVSTIYCDHRPLHKLTGQECHRMCNKTIYIRSQEESKALADIQYPHIILAGSGMATGGRVLHHLKRLLPDYRTTVLLVGYQAGGTRGASLAAGESVVKIHGEYIPVKARVENVDGLSGHADYLQLTRWVQQSGLKDNTQIYLVHGEPDAADRMRLHLQAATPHAITVAEYRQIVRL